MREPFYYSLTLITIYFVLISELCLGVVVLLFDLAPEGGGSLLLHPPDVWDGQLQPRVQRAEHHPATHFLPHTIIIVKQLVTCTRNFYYWMYVSRKGWFL